jgi:hypothetical protein
LEIGETGSINNREYTTFADFELDFQLYFSHTSQDDGENKRVRRVTEFKERELYAYKDITTSLYKRIRVLSPILNDGKIVYEVLVRCIDYGCNINISTYQLIRLPTRFRTLPPQVKMLLFVILLTLYILI